MHGLLDATSGVRVECVCYPQPSISPRYRLFRRRLPSSSSAHSQPPRLQLCLTPAVSFLFLCQDKKYASDKYKDIYTELSIVKAKADCDISRLKEQLKAATEAQGEKSPVNTTVSGYGQSSSSSKRSWVSWDDTCIWHTSPGAGTG